MSQPMRISRFEVLQHPDGSPHVLGEDTELTIYLARESETGTPAVLRVPGPALQRNPAARHRFLEEAREMAQVKHPHIAAVLHFGDTTAGAYVAMELCDGLTLQKAIEEVGALPWQEAFRLGLQLSSVLETLDRHGLVHRGLRPTNIIVTTGSDGHAHLKITEYGRVSENTIRDTVAATKSGLIPVPGYASPEEFLANAPADARALQYALGAVLWFCLTGSPPFAGTQFEIMFQHVNTEPDWKKLPSMPAPVLAVMKLLLAKSAADRFASPAAVTAAIRSATAGTNAAPPKHAALDAPTTGPTALAWLKARQTLLLDEVHPLLARVAELMDTAADGATPLDTALERVLIEIDGWTTLPESQRAALLRTPLIGWPRWQVKLSPDPSLKGPEPALFQAASFVSFCHRLLTGQGKGAGRHVPTAALSEEGNAFFEKHLGTDAARGLSCRGLLETLCEAEEVSLGQPDELTADPLATRMVPGHSQSAPDVSSGQKQQAWLAREREALERARRDLSAQEADRARRMAEEQAHVEKLRRSLDEQKAQLEEKRREQQRLEQELQLRAQLEFQKLQEEAKARESVLQHKRSAAEEALRQREAEFRTREQERFARLEQLKHENQAMEERVQQDYLTLRHVERRQAQLTASSPPVAPQNSAAETIATSPPPGERPPTAPVTTERPSTSTGPVTAGGIILARLKPLETPPTPRASPPVMTDPTHVRQRHKLVVVLISLLVAGVLALIGAAAVTLFSDGQSEVSTPPEEKPPFVPPDSAPTIRTPTPTPTPSTPTPAPTPTPTPKSISKSPSTPAESLRALLEQAQSSTGGKDALRPKALELVAKIAAQPQAEATSATDTLREAAHTWKLPEAWLALASLESDEDTKLELYLQAARLGNTHAQSLAGRQLLEQGVRTRHGGMIQQAVAQLSDAIAGRDVEAMMALGDALYTGRGPAMNKAEGRALVERAASLKHEPAREWLRKHKK